MEKPLCKICKTRHWSNDGCPAEGKLNVRKLAGLKPATHKIDGQDHYVVPVAPEVAAVIDSAIKRSFEPVVMVDPPEKSDGSAVSPIECPVCAARMARQRVATAKYRMKKRVM